ncbi:hypothetical protein VE23_12510 [Paenibacillus sp. D9]|uniref:hypothetical protein n=1 Tax=Paenibacillus sp. D9 TaxID=665792 RepID=UPI00061FD93E|nr:hypothetical protein [Paenibacillus sp. D9]KKC47743.1 hypothetical protein VE23_12510 [Paenibacillus sp. D9]
MMKNLYTKQLFSAVCKHQPETLQAMYSSDGEAFVKEVHRLCQIGYVRTYRGNLVYGGDNVSPIEIVDATAFEPTPKGIQFRNSL